jgi:hypothetical protein
MPALFNAKASFSIPSRGLFVISGEILSGAVKKGMTMKVRMNSSFAIPLLIEGVEVVTKTEGSEVGLTTVCRDAEELSMLQSLNIGGEQIEVADPEEEANQPVQPTPGTGSVSNLKSPARRG